MTNETMMEAGVPQAGLLAKVQLFTNVFGSVIKLAQHAGLKVGRGELIGVAEAVVADVLAGMSIADALKKEIVKILPDSPTVGTPKV